VAVPNAVSLGFGCTFEHGNDTPNEGSHNGQPYGQSYDSKLNHFGFLTPTYLLYGFPDYSPKSVILSSYKKTLKISRIRVFVMI